jgi:dihydroorotate dehydrogenase|tara:strand:+ start:1581 stop:2579 length:999 start_codon:yes stop_codon:yes gene_type:complete
MDPEKAHYKTVSLFRIALALPLGKSIIKNLYNYQSPKLEKKLFGLTFKNPVGLAAGFDKDGKFYREMSHLGFGFIEIGTVTPLPQVGNPKPRLFRLPIDEGLINRMGFNNDGVDAMVERLKKFKAKDVIIGGNIGKNKTTPNEEALNDYVICFEKLFDFVDYFVVNVSSPNTPGLRDLQDKGPLTAILSKLMDLNNARPSQKPILLKIAPDLTNSQLDDIVDIVADTKIDGVIATNTTISREGLMTDQNTILDIGNGGLSGAPVKSRSTEVISYLHKKSGGAFPIVGVGGIDGVDSAKEKIAAGASLIQVYSGFIYQGPGLVKSINKGLVKG